MNSCPRESAIVQHVAASAEPLPHDLAAHLATCPYCREVTQVQRLLQQEARALQSQASLAHPSSILWRAEINRRSRKAELCALPLRIVEALILLMAVGGLTWAAANSPAGTSEWFLWVGSVLAAVAVGSAWLRTQIKFRREVLKTNYSGFMSRFTLFLCLLSAPAFNSFAAEGPEFDEKGHLKFPANYREWIYLSSGLGMTYGPAASAASAANPLFDNVFVNPPAWAEFKKTGKWPEGTVFVLEIRRSTSNGSINKGGHFQADTAAIEVEVKDTKRFSKGWAFYDFRAGATSAPPLGPNTSCQGCHSTNGAVENTFVQFYPTALPIAKSKGTLKADVKEAN